MIRVLLSLMMVVIFATPADADQISGKAEAVDPTVIAINGQRIMLFGIESVMRKQSCTTGGKVWQCWPAALRNLEILLDQGPVTCDSVGEPDVYGRLLARCNVNGESLNGQLVRAGWAIDRRSETVDYVAAEAEAKEKKLGLWQGEFMMPDAFRGAAGIFVDRP
jgi:endonuclease YncB( thermonuclease family)